MEVVPAKEWSLTRGGPPRSPGRRREEEPGPCGAAEGCQSGKNPGGLRRGRLWLRLGAPSVGCRRNPHPHRA